MSDVALKMSQSDSAAVAARRKTSTLGRMSGWYGVWFVIATEGSLFAYLLFSYYYCLMQAGVKWPVSGPPPLALASIGTIFLVASSGALAWSQWSLAKEERPRLIPGVALTLVFGSVFLSLQALDLAKKAPAISANTYNSFYVLLAGLDFLHVAAGVIALVALLAWTIEGRLIGIRTSYVSIIAAYWHFIVVVWLSIFATMFLLPYAS
jgi:heme/copper-type cytochrome/quinol oxidase subunit 3